MAVEI